MAVSSVITAKKKQPPVQKQQFSRLAEMHLKKFVAVVCW